MNFELLHPADQLVMLMERIYQYGMTTTSGGNLSILDENGDIWITPGSVDKGSLSRKDIIQVKPDGTIIGIHKPSSEFPVHERIYRARPDIKAILHAHPPALVAFSIVRKIPETRLIPNFVEICGNVSIAPYDVPGSQGLSVKVTNEFQKGNNVVMLENHGVFVGASDLFKAFMSFETLDYCARLQIEASKIGNIRPLSDKYIKISKEKQHVEMDEFVNKSISSEEREARREMCTLIKRAYDQQLFTSTQGTFSQRLSDGSFLITPYYKDRKYMEESDLVRIVGDWKEAGKLPSRSVLLHKKIYEKHPDINSIIIAHAPYVMTFAVTDCEFDSRTIPESYIMLRDVKKIPFGASFMQPDMVADMFEPMTPILIAENDCVIVTGSSLINAFDKLEVMEYSAKAIVSSKVLGDIVAITDDEIKDLRAAFHF
ncbi:MAG: class II aldolase/adducin family protein [Clostridiales bacterium]|jgi:class II aldolase/adducin family protein|nr:class II aldolase/adducin family protein [Clostridiales bacterium]